jgi:hypothetical protein
MKSFRITCTDGSHWTTPANGTLEEVTAYFMQFGGIVVDENFETGEETRRYIATVEEVTRPAPCAICNRIPANHFEMDHIYQAPAE